MLKEYRRSTIQNGKKNPTGCSLVFSGGYNKRDTKLLLGGSVLLRTACPNQTPHLTKVFKNSLTFPQVKYRFAGKAYRVLFFKKKIEFRFHRSHKFYFYYNPKITKIGFRKNK